jgi:hypothetical protein
MPFQYQNLDDNIYVTTLFRLVFGKSITVHTLTDGVVEKVKHTKLENVPHEIPELMKRSFLLEARHDKPLFDDVYSIGGFTFNDEICLMVGLKDNYFTQREKSSFDGRGIEDMNLLCAPIVGKSPFIGIPAGSH